MTQKVTLSFTEYDSSNNPTSNSFDITFKLKKLPGDNTLFVVPLFNFQIVSLNGGYLKSTQNCTLAKLVPSSLQFNLPCNDAFLNGNTDLGVQFVQGTLTNFAVSSFTWTLNVDGSITINSADPNYSFLPLGSHTQLSTTFPLKTICNSSDVKLFTLVCWSADFFGYPIPGTEFNVQLTFQKIRKNIYNLTILPFTFNIPDTFSEYDWNYGPYPTPSPWGGTLKTKNNILPECLFPNTDQNYVIPVLNPDENTPLAYNLMINTHGQIQMNATKYGYGQIPQGTYNIQQMNFTYLSGNPYKHGYEIDNFVIQKEFTNITQFTAYGIYNGIRDFHVHDTYEDHIYWSWTGNPDQFDTSNNVMDLYLAKAKIGKSGKKKILWVKNLTSLPANYMAWETSVAINRKNPSIISVSYGRVDHITHRLGPRVIILHNYGENFISDTEVDPGMLHVGDIRGVLADTCGNFWYGTDVLDTSLGNYYPQTYISRDYGSTWNLVTSALLTHDPNINYDFPQIAFGPDGLGNHGLWVSINVQDLTNPTPVVTLLLQFIDVNTLTTQSLLLPTAVGLQDNVGITVRNDGAVFLYGVVATWAQSCTALIVKKPGTLTLNNVQNAVTVYDNAYFPTSAAPSYPIPNSWPSVDGANQAYYPPTTINNLFFVPNPKAKCKQRMYAIINEVPFLYSQDHYLSALYSDDDGKTWSKKVKLTTTNKNNRGFSYFMYNQKHNKILSGLYDCRNDPNSFKMQFFGGELKVC